MSYTYSATETYSVVDVETVMRRVTADLVMIASSTGGVTEEHARKWGHDIEALAKAGYLRKVDLTLLSNGIEVKATTFEVNTNSGELTTSRPGGALWPNVSNPELRIVLSYTDAYDTAAREKMAGKLKIGWVRSTVDLTHPTLKSSGGRDYVSNSYGMQRKDFT